MLTLQQPAPVDTRWPWAIGAVLYGSTLYFSNNSALLLLLPLLFLLRADIRHLHQTKSAWLMVAFVAAGLLNAAYGAVVGGHPNESLRAAVTLPIYLLTIYLSRAIEDIRVRKTLYLFILLECAIGCVQFYFGNPHPFPGQFDNAFVDYSDLTGFQGLYFNRVYGLSSSSSVFAQKIFILAVLLLGGDFWKFSRVVRVLITCLVAGALAATFNRTVILALILLLVLLLIKNYSKTSKRLLMFLIPACIVIASYSAQSAADSAETLSFGVNAGGLVSRYLIWANSLDFIRQHLLWGNHSTHILFDYFGTDLHAHNSFLQMIANHGLPIALLLFAFVLLNISKANFPFVIAILIYSLTQYGIFWAISTMDLVFYYFLVTKNRPPHAYSWDWAPVGLKASTVTSGV